MHTLHHALARTINQHCAFTAHGLTNERELTLCFYPLPQHRGVKLNELHVRHCNTSTQSQRQTIACYCWWVRSRGKHLAKTTCCHHHRTRSDITNVNHQTRSIEPRHTHTHCSLFTIATHSEQHIHRKGVFHYFNTRHERRLVERALHFSTRLVATGMHNAAMRMPTFTGEIGCAIGTWVERCA